MLLTKFYIKANVFNPHEAIEIFFQHHKYVELIFITNGCVRLTENVSKIFNFSRLKIFPKIHFVNRESDIKVKTLDVDKLERSSTAEDIFRLGLVLFEGITVQRDVPRALELFWDICEHIPLAYCFIAKEVDNKRQLLLRSFELGCSTAAHDLGILSSNEGDYEGAINFFLQSKSGPSFSCIAKLCQKQREVNHYFEKARKSGESTCLNDVGCRKLAQGYYVSAKNYFERAIKIDANVAALSNYGYVFFEGLGVRENFPKAKFYTKLATKMGSHEALFNLGFIYFHEGKYFKARDVFEENIRRNFNVPTCKEMIKLCNS